MSTIAQNLAALQQAKEDIAEAIEDMGGTVQEGDGFSSFAADILTIPAGGGGTLQEKTVALDMSAGDQEISPDSGYDGLSKAVITRPATLIPENIKDGVSIGGIAGNFVGSAIPNELDGLVDGTQVNFTMPVGKTTVQLYLFYDDTALQTANLQGATTIKDYAFSKCSNAEITLPSTLTSIGRYAFQNAGKSSALMELETVSNCSVGDYAFQNAKISKVKGKYTAIGVYAFQGCGSLTEVNISSCTGIGQNAFAGAFVNSASVSIRININGSIGAYAFHTNYYIYDISITGNVTFIDAYAFYRIGYARQNPSTNIMYFDFKNSSFSNLGNYAFGGQNQTTGLNYTEIILPNSCTTIGAYAFYYIKNSNIYFTREIPATIQSNTFTGMSNTNLWIPYNSVNAYRTAANWSASEVVSAIKGYAPANTFTTGQTLPTINEEGYGLTWYSDKACTVQVTTVSDPTQELYCIVGTTILAYRIQSVNTMDCTVTFSDGTNTYVQGDQVPVGTSLTIASVATDPTKTQVYMFDINGTDYKPSSSETITVASDISVIALYYDGVNPPVDPVLNNNTWQQILIGCQNGLAGTLWQVGDTKTDSTGLVWAIVDLKNSRYQRADGTGYTKCTFMPVGRCFDQTTTWYTSSTTENYSQSLVNTELSTGGVFYNQIDPTLAALVDQNKIIVKASQASSSATVDCTVGFFAACYTEMGYTGSYNYATNAETICNGVTMGAFEYFASNTNSLRIRYDSTNAARAYWLRSRYFSNIAVFVGTAGSFGSSSVTGNNRVCPCFAF